MGREPLEDVPHALAGQPRQPLGLVQAQPMGHVEHQQLLPLVGRQRLAHAVARVPLVELAEGHRAVVVRVHHLDEAFGHLGRQHLRADAGHGATGGAVAHAVHELEHGGQVARHLRQVDPPVAVPVVVQHQRAGLRVGDGQAQPVDHALQLQQVHVAGPVRVELAEERPQALLLLLLFRPGLGPALFLLLLLAAHRRHAAHGPEEARHPLGHLVHVDWGQPGVEHQVVHPPPPGVRRGRGRRLLVGLGRSRGAVLRHLQAFLAVEAHNARGAELFRQHLDLSSV
mmetsp:Transcript_22249/g.38332  ORF Transcript_22249/g.38332 Transcript_22249/m.38332 type:complete len:284 (-) Transcript_22249:388-1239(-)